MKFNAFINAPAWVNSTDPNGGAFYSSYNGVDPDINFGMSSAGFAIRDAERDGASADVDQSEILDGNWHFVAGVRDSQTSIRYYLDGQLMAADSNPLVGSIDIFGQNPTIGTLSNFPTSHPSHLLQGLIDEVGVYNRALSDEEIKDIFDAGSEGKCKPPPPCILDLEANYIDATLTMGFDIGTLEPATWHMWLMFQT